MAEDDDRAGQFGGIDPHLHPVDRVPVVVALVDELVLSTADQPDATSASAPRPSSRP